MSKQTEALKLALKRLERSESELHKARATIREALAEQPAQQQSAERVDLVAYDKTEINCFAQDLYDQKMREGKRGHYESMFHVIHQCIKKVSPPANANAGKPWVGLTEDEIDFLELKYAPPIHPDFETDADHCYVLIKKTEAKLKEKNA